MGSCSSGCVGSAIVSMPCIGSSYSCWATDISVRRMTEGRPKRQQTYLCSRSSRGMSSAASHPILTDLLACLHSSARSLLQGACSHVSPIEDLAERCRSARRIMSAPELVLSPKSSPGSSQRAPNTISEARSPGSPKSALRRRTPFAETRLLNPSPALFVRAAVAKPPSPTAILCEIFAVSPTHSPSAILRHSSPVVWPRPVSTPCCPAPTLSLPALIPP